VLFKTKRAYKNFTRSGGVPHGYTMPMGELRVEDQTS